MRTLHSQLRWCTHIQWMLGLGLAVSLSIFYLMGYRPSVNRLAALQARIESKQRELGESRSKAGNLESLAARVRDLERQVAIYNRQFPGQMDLGRFIRDITQVGQQLSLAGCRFQPGAMKMTDRHVELPILMEFDGDFLNVASFIRQLEEMERLTRVQKLELKSKDASSGAVKVNLAMNIYFSEG